MVKIGAGAWRPWPGMQNPGYRQPNHLQTKSDLGFVNDIPMEQQKQYLEPPRAVAASSPPAADAARVDALLVHGVQPAPPPQYLSAPPPGLSFAAGAQPAMQANTIRGTPFLLLY